MTESARFCELYLLSVAGGEANEGEYTFQMFAEAAVLGMTASP